MTQITTRAGKGSPLTHDEMDQNLVNLNTDKAEGVDLAALDDRVSAAETALADTAPAGHTHTAAAIAVIPTGSLTSTDVQEALEALTAGKEDASNRGAPNGYAALDVSGRVPLTQLPDALSHDKGYHPTPAALMAAYPVANEGDHAIVDSTATQWLWDDGAWVDSDTKGQVSRVNGQVGDVTVTAADIPYVPSAPLVATNLQEAIEDARIHADAFTIGGVTVYGMDQAMDGDGLRIGVDEDESFIYPWPLTASASVLDFPASGTLDFAYYTNAQVVDFVLIGAAEGGESGEVTGPGQVARGGRGGAGGAVTRHRFMRVDLPSSLAVVVGIGGDGGPASAGAANPGGPGGNTSIMRFTEPLLTAGGGNNDGAGMGGQGELFGAQSHAAHPNGAQGTAAPNETRYPTTGGDILVPAQGAPAGGAGGGVTATNIDTSGGGQASPFLRSGNFQFLDTGGRPGGGNGPTGGPAGYPGYPGGGGGGNATGPGGSGGKGVYGGGGGGGGGARTGFLSGAGGKGADGRVLVFIHY